MKTCFVLRLVFLLTLASLQAEAQTPKLTWLKTIGTSATLTMKQPLTDQAGNLYITDYFNGTLDLDPGPGTYPISDTDGNNYIAKFDSLGGLLWGHATNARISCWNLDQDGTVWYIADFKGTVDFDPGPGTYTLSSTDFSRCLGSITADGSFNSALDMKLPISVRTSALAATTFSQIYVTGGFKGSVDFDPDTSTHILTSSGAGGIFVASYTAAGLVDAFALEGPGSGVANTMAVSGNNYVIGGSFSGSLDFAPDADTAFLHSSAAGSGFVAEYDFAGRTVSAHALGSAVSSVTAVPTPGAYMIYGRIGDSVDVDPGPGRSMLYPVNASDAFILRMTPASASVSFAKAVRVNGTYYSQSLAASKNGGLLISGYKQATMDFNGGAASGIVNQLGGPDGFLSKFDASGAHKYAFPIAAQSVASMSAVTAAPDGSIYVAGSCNGPLDLDPGPGTRMTPGPTTFIARYLDYEVLSVPGGSGAADIEVYSANRLAYIDFSACRVVQATIRVTGIDGRTILETAHNHAGMRRLDLGDIAAGIYIVTVQNGTDRISRKISIQ